MTRLAVSLALLAALVCTAPAPLRAMDEVAERQSIERALTLHLLEGHRDRKAEQVMALYLPDAEIVTYISGKIDRSAFGAKVEKELANYVAIQPRLEIQEVTFKGEDEALMQVTLLIAGERTDGKKGERGDRLWLLLKKGPDGWKIRKQGYRSDFTVGEGSHPKSAH